MRNNQRKRQSNDLRNFIVGLAMLVAGLYWLTTKVSVSSSFFGGTMALGGINMNSGLVVVPFIVCIIWLFTNPDSFFAKVCVGLSILLIIAAIILNTRLYMQTTSLYEYLIMLIFIFGGGALVLKVLCNPKYRDRDDDADSYSDYMDELDDIRKRRK